MSSPTWTPTPGRRTKYTRPKPLDLKKPDPLPATVYCPEFDEPRAVTPTDISGLFDNSDTSSSSSAVSSRAESPVDRARIMAVRGRGTTRSLKSRGSSKEVKRREGTAPSSPVTPMSPFSPNHTFKPPTPTSATPPDQPPTRPDSRRPSRKAGAILGLGLAHPVAASLALPTASRASTPTATRSKDPILGGWDVSDDDKPTKPIPLKTWQPLAVKKTPPIPSVKIGRSASMSARGRTRKIEQPQPRNAARFSDRGFGQGTIDEDGIAPFKKTPETQSLKIATHHSHSTASIHHPSSKPSSSSSSTASSFRNLDLPKRSPSAPIVTSMSTVSFELDEYPVIFSNLPIEETDIFNIIPTDFIMSDDLAAQPEYTLHPSWTTSDSSVYAASDAARKAELAALAEMMDPASPQTVPFRTRYNSVSVTVDTLPEVPSPASIRPDSRWSDYSEADSVKESWRSSVMHHLHLPSVTAVRRKLDLRAPVAAAKEGIRKMAVLSVPEMPEEDRKITESSLYSLPAALAAANRASTSIVANRASATVAAHRASTSSGSGLVFRRIATGRSDSIVTLSKSILRPESRAEKPGSSGSSIRLVTGDRPGSAKSTVVSPVGSPTSDEEKVQSPRGGRFKDVFGKWDARKKEEKRRMELKRKITVIGAGRGSEGGFI